MSFLADKRKRKIFIITASVVLTLAIIVGLVTITVRILTQSARFCHRAQRGMKNPVG